MSNKQSMVLVMLISLQALISQQVQAQQVDESFYQRPGVTAAQILRARGYLAEEQFITTTDGYILKLTRGTNPKIDDGSGGLAHRAPVLFVHGVISDPTLFLVNSFDARAKDLSGFDLGGNASGLASEPSAKSLPLLALNFGHEVWLLSRRGTPGSQRKLGNPNSVAPGAGSAPDRDPYEQQQQLHFNSTTTTTTFSPAKGRPQTLTSVPAALVNYGHLPELLAFSFDQNFWNYSYDEQAQYDIPLAIEHVLDQTGREQLAYVGHSGGGALFLMTLSLYPELADKISSAVLWSPAPAEGNGDLTNILFPLEPLFDFYIGSFPPAVTTTPLQAVLGLVCATSLTQRTLCESLLDLVMGPSFGQQPLYPEFLNSALHATGSHEYAQYLQSTRLGGSIHKFDYGPEGNQVAYGQRVPPAYDFSRIRSRSISLYGGATDALVSPSDAGRISRQLKVPHKFHVVRPVFNHVGYFFHDNTASLVIIPSLRDIQNVN